MADSLVVSLLTCEPGQESYELYGHTALRVRTADNRVDVVYNYGAFTLDEPHFVWRFLMGQTDYMLIREPSRYLRFEYLDRGRGIREQVLNLTSQEALRLVERVDKEARTPGWTYRYNFFRDNCTTRAISAIRDAIEGKLSFDNNDSDIRYRTLREVVSEHTATPMPWSDFGENLLLGCEVDTLLDRNGLQAFPEDAFTLIQHTQVCRADGIAPLVGSENYISPTRPPETQATMSFLLQPLGVSLLVLLLSLTLSVRQWCQREKGTRLFDGSLMLVTGAAGCLIWLLFWFSELPAVGSNWLILFLSPLPLLWLPRKIAMEWRGRSDIYITMVQPWTASFGLLVACVMQVVQWPVYVLALSLLIRSTAELKARRVLFTFHKKVCIGVWFIIYAISLVIKIV